MNKKKKLWTVIGVVALVVVLVAAALIGRFAPAADPHAGHDHDADPHTSTTADPHAGHNHGDSLHTTAKPDGNTANTVVCIPTKNDDGTYSFVLRDQKGHELFRKSGLDRAPLTERISDQVYSVGWPTGAGPNDYQQVYYHLQTGQVSQVFDSPLASDGVRVIVPRALKKSYAVIVQDLFDAKVYSKTYPLPGAYTGGDYTVVGGKLDPETKKVRVTYLVSEKAERTAAFIPLYPEDK